MPNLNLTDDQKEKLRAGYRRAQEIPKGFDMSDWARRSISAPCGTECCYAGELLLANNPEIIPRALITISVGHCIPREALKLLDLQRINTDDFPLFYVNNWPEDLQEEYQEAGRNERPSILAKVVERFIEADGDTSDW